MGYGNALMALAILIGNGLPIIERFPEPRGPVGCPLGALQIHGPMDADEFDRRLAKVDRNDPATAGDVLEILAPVVYHYPSEEKWLIRKLGLQVGNVMLALADDPREKVRWYALSNLSEYVSDPDTLKRCYRRYLGKADSDWLNVHMAIELRALSDTTPEVIEVIAADGGNRWEADRPGGISDFRVEEFLIVVESLLDPHRPEEYKANAAWTLRFASHRLLGHQDLVARLLPELNAEDPQIRFWAAAGLLWLRYYDEDVQRELLAQGNQESRLKQQIVPALLTWKPHDPGRLEPFVDAILDNLEDPFFLDHKFEDLADSKYLPPSFFKGVTLSREQKDRLIPLIRNSRWHEEIVQVIRASDIEDPALEKVIAGYPENMEPKRMPQIIRRFPGAGGEDPFNLDPADDPFGDPEDPFGD